MRSAIQPSLDRRSFLAAAGLTAAALSSFPASGMVGARARRVSLPWTEVAEGVSVIADLRLGGNVLLAHSGSAALLVDTKFPYLAETLRADALETAGAGTTLAVVNTHHHGDHTGGNVAFVGRHRVHAHPNAARRVREQIETYKTNARQSVQQAVRNNLDEAAVGRAEAIAERADALAADEFTPRDLIRGNEMSMQLGVHPVELHHFGPGHTDNDVAVRIPHVNVLHTGDLVFNGTHPFFDQTAGVTAFGWLASLWRLYGLCDADTVVVPGHGEVGDRGLIRNQIEYTRSLIDAVGEDIAAGLSKEEAQEKTYPFMEGLQFGQIRPRAIAAVYDELSE